jgi:tRNA pseudouridine55 synthase
MAYTNNQVIFKDSTYQSIDFLKGVVLLVDKPIGWTSFDVVNKLRFKIKHGLGIKKIKVGHAGTLDPNASGLLIVCTGKLTKEIDTLQAKEKIYSGTIRLGATTPTYDIESDIDEFFPVDHITDEALEVARAGFLGPLSQIPPVYSAIKIDGQKSYDLARRGKEVEMKARPVTIYSFDLTSKELPEINFIVRCSKGTYIRSLAYDFGKALQSGAFLSSLRREAIGDFSVDHAFSIDEMIEFLGQATSGTTGVD